MFKSRFVLTVALMGFVALTTVPATQAGDTLTQLNRLTFNGAVSLPGVVLPAGTYVFEAGASGTHRDIVRVTSPDDRQVLYLGFTQRTPRPAGMARSQLVSFGEAPVGGPLPIVAWYPIGSNLGHEFRHR